MRFVHHWNFQEWLYTDRILKMCTTFKFSYFVVRSQLIWKIFFFRMKKWCFWIALFINENLMFLKLSSERNEWETFEWFWHPESNLVPKFHDFSMHEFFNHFACFPEPVGTLHIVWTLVLVHLTMASKPLCKNIRICDWLWHFEPCGGATLSS